MDTNVVHKVKKIKLPVSKVLLPLFEAVINSIQAIEDSAQSDGYIQVEINRSHFQTGLIDDGELSPIEGFTILDNGIGFNTENYKSFVTADTDYKMSKGSKGVGRFLWLKTFSNVEIESLYRENNEQYFRKFIFSNTKAGISFHENNCIENGKEENRTTVVLKGLQPPYREKCPQQIEKISLQILEHCISYFLLETAPKIKALD